MSSIHTVLFSLGCRAFQLICSLVVVRHLVGILGVPEYGVWVTMTAAMVWMSLFDFGVGYGIKNRVSELSARGSSKELQFTASIALVFYAITTVVVSIAFLLIALFVSPFSDRPIASIILFAGASASFFMSFGGVVLQGIGAFRTFYALSIIGPFLWASAVMFHSGRNWTVTEASVFFVSSTLIQSVVTLAIGISQAGGFIRIPIGICIKEISTLLKVGSGFLISQVSSIALFMSGNFLVYRSLGAKDAAIYDTTNKFFQFFILGFSILVNIAWTEISKSKALGDLQTSKKIFRGLISMGLLAGFGALIFSFISNQVVSFLTRGGIHIESSSAFFFVPLILIQTLSYSGAVFLNAYEELTVQNILSVTAIPLFFILVHVLLGFGMRVGAIPLACAFAVLPAMFYCLYRGYMLSQFGKLGIK